MQIHAHTQTLHNHNHSHTHIHTQTHTQPTYTDTYTYMYIHTFTFIFILILIHKHTLPYKKIYVNIHQTLHTCFLFLFLFFALMALFHSKFTRTIQLTHSNQNYYTPYCSRRWGDLIHSYGFFIFFSMRVEAYIFSNSDTKNSMRKNESDISACLLRKIRTKCIWI